MPQTKTLNLTSQFTDSTVDGQGDMLLDEDAKYSTFVAGGGADD